MGNTSVHRKRKLGKGNNFSGSLGAKGKKKWNKFMGKKKLIHWKKRVPKDLLWRGKGGDSYSAGWERIGIDEKKHL